MMPNEIILIPYRIIPCDFGHHVSTDILEGITEYLKSAQHEVISAGWSATDEAEILVVRLNVRDSDVHLYLHLFADGIGTFTLIDKEEVHRVKEFNPEVTLNLRKKAHKEILTHTHEVSGMIDEVVSEIRKRFDEDKARHTASPSWENKGISYVISFYFIKTDINSIEEPAFKEKLAFLLFPFYATQNAAYPPEGSTLNKYTVKGNFGGEFLHVVEKDYELLPYVYTCGSWTNFLIIGNITNKIQTEYWKLERDLQHVWFYSYITEKFIERSLKDISTRTPEKELERIDNILTEMIFKIGKYEGIIKSTMHERTFRLYEALRTTSRLDMLLNTIDKEAKLLKDRYNWLLSEKRNKVDKKIQLILFIIAVLSGISAYKTFENLGAYSILAILASILLGVYFFRPFLANK